MSIIPLWVKILGFSVVLAIAIGGSGYLGYDYGFNKADDNAKTAVVAQQQADLKAQQEIQAEKDATDKKYNALAQQLQDTQQQLQKANQNVKVKVVHEIASNPVYHSCTMPASGVQLINDQARQYNSIRSGSSTN
jgi:peptide subunit release factor RF-3